MKLLTIFNKTCHKILTFPPGELRAGSETKEGKRKPGRREAPIPHRRKPGAGNPKENPREGRQRFQKRKRAQLKNSEKRIIHGFQRKNFNDVVKNRCCHVVVVVVLVAVLALFSLSWRCSRRSDPHRCHRHRHRFCGVVLLVHQQQQ